MKTKTKLSIIVWIVIGVLIWLAYKTWHMYSVKEIQMWIMEFGPKAPLIFIAIMAVGIIALIIPTILLDIMGGGLFGTLKGGTYILIASMIGASIAFAIARKFGRPLSQKFMTKTVNMCDHCPNSYLFTIILLSRLFPVFSFGSISYTSGLTKISFKNYFFATFIGVIPLAYLTAYTGDALFKGNIILTIVLAIILMGTVFIVPKIIHARSKKHKKAPRWKH